MQRKCEVFENGKCLGCNGLEYDIDRLKKKCETYKRLMFYEKGEQIVLGEINEISKRVYNKN